MKNSFAFGAFAAALCALPLLSTSIARADLSSCGNIDVDATGMCETEVSGGCTANCTPVSFEAACAADLEATCEGSCPQVPSVTCEGSCDATCEADCNAQPAQFDCTANCKADATAQCSAQCNSSSDKAHCTASCQANFAAECNASCTGKPATATCMAKCQGRCEGSCTAQTKLQCQVNCQGMGYASCETRLQGGCTADCMDPQGALYCNGQYVDHNGTVNDCIASIRAALPTVVINVSATSSGMSSCTGSSCQASGEAQASASCAFAPSSPNSANAYGALAGFIALGAVCFRRRRAR